MPDEPRKSRPRGSRPWLLATVLSGLLLAISIVFGLGATLTRHGKVLDLLNEPGTHPEELARLAGDSARLTKLSLWTGTPIALLYITSLVMYRRSRKP